MQDLLFLPQTSLPIGSTSFGFQYSSSPGSGIGELQRSIDEEYWNPMISTDTRSVDEKCGTEFCLNLLYIILCCICVMYVVLAIIKAILKKIYLMKNNYPTFTSEAEVPILVNPLTLT